MRWIINLPDATPDEARKLREQLQSIDLTADNIFLTLFKAKRFQAVDTVRNIAYNYDGAHIEITEKQPQPTQ
jgi:hypothetical protein